MAKGRNLHSDVSSSIKVCRDIEFTCEEAMQVKPDQYVVFGGPSANTNQHLCLEITDTRMGLTGEAAAYVTWGVFTTDPFIVSTQTCKDIFFSETSILPFYPYVSARYDPNAGSELAGFSRAVELGECTPDIPLAYDRGVTDEADEHILKSTHYKLQYDLGDGLGYRCGCTDPDKCRMIRFSSENSHRDIIRHETCNHLQYYGPSAVSVELKCLAHYKYPEGFPDQQIQGIGLEIDGRFWFACMGYSLVDDEPCIQYSIDFSDTQFAFCRQTLDTPVNSRPVTSATAGSGFIAFRACSADCMDPSPCQNGATCQQSLGSFACSCVAGFAGNLCGTACIGIQISSGGVGAVCEDCPTEENQVANTEHSECVCAADYYEETGQCVKCPDNSASDLGSDEINDCVCNPGYGLNDEATGDEDHCLLCPPGQFGSDGECHDCASGHHSSTAGSEQGDPCPAGSVPNLEKTDCELCPAGTFTGEDGLTECEECQPGFYSPDDGSTECTPCSPGHFSGTSASSECNPCPAGTFTDEEGLAECEECLAGFYSEEAATECTPCSPGHFSDTAGSSQCDPCPAGMFANEEGLAECKECLAGFYSEEAAAECTPCPPGHFSDSPGSTQCLACNGGTAPNEGHTGCVECPRNTYSTSGDDTCTDCHSDKPVTTGAGQDHCIACITGCYTGGEPLTGFYPSCGGCDEYFYCYDGYPKKYECRGRFNQYDPKREHCSRDSDVICPQLSGLSCPRNCPTYASCTEENGSPSQCTCDESFTQVGPYCTRCTDGCPQNGYCNENIGICQCRSGYRFYSDGNCHSSRHRRVGHLKLKFTGYHCRNKQWLLGFTSLFQGSGKFIKINTCRRGSTIVDFEVESETNSTEEEGTSVLNEILRELTGGSLLIAGTPVQVLGNPILIDDDGNELELNDTCSLCMNDASCGQQNASVIPVCRCTDEWTGPFCSEKRKGPTDGQTNDNTTVMIVGVTMAGALMIIITVSMFVYVMRRNADKRVRQPAPTFFQNFGSISGLVPHKGMGFMVDPYDPRYAGLRDPYNPRRTTVVLNPYSTR